MSGATCSNRVKLEGQIITVATVQGTSQDVFAAQTFTLQRLRWVEDGEVTVCQGCGNKFSQLRRKHHCRQCGDIYCAKCCKDKMVLPHIECPTSERVCDGCKSVAQLLVKGVDTSMGSKLEAAQGLVQCIRGTDERNNSQELLDMGFTSLKKVLELGGLQMLVHLVRNSNAELQEVLVPGLHSLVTHAPLHPHLLRAGVLSALARILSARNARCKETLEFSLEALLILCKSSETKVKAVHSGIVEPVLDLAKSGSPEVTLLALTCLSCMFESPDTHSVALNNLSLLGDLLELADTTDEQVQEVTLRILAYLVMGDNDDEIKVSLSKMDSSNKKIFQRALQSRPKNPQLLCTCACLVANLATAQGAQHFICDYSIWLGNLVENFPTNTKVLQHATRGLANMAHYSQHSSTLIQLLPRVRDTCIKGQDEVSKQQAVRMVLSLLVHSTHAVITTLTSEGVSEFLQALVSMPNTLAALQSEICRSVPTLSPPV